MKPEDKKPRKRKNKKATVEKEQLEGQPQAVELKDHLQEKIHTLKVLKGQWNEYYRNNREDIM
jgi:hypothetical protein